jgi:hypothetical protein
MLRTTSNVKKRVRQRSFEYASNKERIEMIKNAHTAFRRFSPDEKMKTLWCMLSGVIMKEKQVKKRDRMLNWLQSQYRFFFESHRKSGW